MPRTLFRFIVAAHLCVVGNPPLFAQSELQGYGARGTLKGYDSIHVLVQDDATDELLKTRLTALDLRNRIELELRKAGVSLKENFSLPALQLRVMSIEREADVFIYFMTLRFRVRVPPDKDIPEGFFDSNGFQPGPDLLSAAEFWTRGAGLDVTADVWAANRLGQASTIDARSIFMEGFQSIIEEFLNDYLAANPRARAYHRIAPHSVTVPDQPPYE